MPKYALSSERTVANMMKYIKVEDTNCRWNSFLLFTLQLLVTRLSPQSVVDLNITFHYVLFDVIVICNVCFFAFVFLLHVLSLFTLDQLFSQLR